MSKKKSTNESIKWCIAGALLVLLAMMIQKAYVTITSPLGIAELYAFEYLAMDPEGERCETCVDTLLYWDADTPTDCTLAKVMYPEGI